MPHLLKKLKKSAVVKNIPACIIPHMKSHEYDSARIAAYMYNYHPLTEVCSCFVLKEIYVSYVQHCTAVVFSWTCDRRDGP